MNSLGRHLAIACSLAGLLLGPLGSFAAASTGLPDAGGLYRYAPMKAELQGLAQRDPQLMSVTPIGVSAEHRELLMVHLRATTAPKPAILLIFAQHPDEHDTTLLAMALIRRIVAHDPRAMELLKRCDLYVLPMADPDGVAYDLSGEVAPFTRRGNHREVSPGVWGVNLNRNWGTSWKPGALSPDHGDNPGPVPFSELETRAMRDFLSAHREIRVFLDEHSGASGFNQGEVLYPYSSDDAPAMPKAVSQRYQSVAARVAKLLSDPADLRPAFISMRSPEVRDYVRAQLAKYVPPAHLQQALASVPPSTNAFGAAIDWAQSNLGVLSLGIEASRGFDSKDPADYARKANQGLDGRVDRTLTAMEFLITCD
ncbi:MAG TPA: M14 family metallopeptidase [Oscillatoriaceae cyanobacterium]